MFERILSFLKDLPAGNSGPEMLTDDDPRIAAAALLIHVMNADGVRSADEQNRLSEALSKAYNLRGSDLKTLMRAGEKAEAEAVDLYVFTSVLNRHLDENARTEFIRRMWEIVFADGELHELEDNLVWRIAELIGVDTPTRIAMRQRVHMKNDR